jgi:hypothetical protein
MRDGAIRVIFEILRASGEDNWFGVYFRIGFSPFMGSHLVYARPNRNIETIPAPIYLSLDVPVDRYTRTNSEQFKLKVTFNYFFK